MSNEINDLIESLFVQAPEIRPCLNIGWPFDMVTGTYYIGNRGQSVLNGGLMKLTGVGGRGNMYKSTEMHDMAGNALNNYLCSTLATHDAEGTTVANRYNQLYRYLPNLNQTDLVSSGRLHHTDLTTMHGNEWFKSIQRLAEAKAKNRKQLMRTTPFVDSNGKQIQVLVPTIAELDSISQMTIEAVGVLYDKAEIGEADLNAEAMRSSMAKNQMLMQIPFVCGTGNIHMLISAHLGDEIVMDKYAPSTKKLALLKGNLKFKATPEKFTFLTDLLIVAEKLEILLNQTTKAAEYPRDSSDNLKGSTDLQAVTFRILRNKQGPTGDAYVIYVSQGEGVHKGLSMLGYLKDHKDKSQGYDVAWGMGGHAQSYYLDIYPDVKMQRTTARSLIASDPKLLRAFQITAQLHQFFTLPHHNCPPNLRCTMKELYDDLKAQGYDWDVLLDTQSEYYYEEEAGQHKPFLSEKDLLRMRAGEYKPYWMK